VTVVDVDVEVVEVVDPLFGSGVVTVELDD